MDKIDSDINTEFNQIRNEINLHFEDSLDINLLKDFLATYIPKEIEFRSKALVATLVNSMMSDAIEHLEKYDVSIQNKFIEADFRTKIENLTQELNHQLKLEPELVSFSKDPRIVNGIIAGCATFTIGSAITVVFLNSSNLVSAIISSIATLILTVLAYKFVYSKSTEQSVKKLQSDTSLFLTTAEQQVKEWINSINILFETEFQQFCKQHQLN